MITRGHYRMIFLVFFLSGFCSLLYEVVWLRLAYASFGIITPVLSVVISTFMIGLSIGSWAGGKWISLISEKTRISSLTFYALSEFFIGFGSFAVPDLFHLGEKLLLNLGEADSFLYLLLSAVAIGFSLLPWCVLMGFTYPFMMAFVKSIDLENTNIFSYLYLANVIGAMTGVLLSAMVLVEALGFQNTLMVAACLNFIASMIAIIISAYYPKTRAFPETREQYFNSTKNLMSDSNPNVIFIFAILFITGITSMGMEVTWIRAFMPVLRTKTYSFASLLSVYLLSTWIGSWWYRKKVRQNKLLDTKKLIVSLSICALLPLMMNDPRLHLGIPGVLLSIIPFCTLLGYLTPKLIDQYASGYPHKAGRAYAVNILGCILGPLIVSYFLLPYLGVKWSMITMALPFLGCVMIYMANGFPKQTWIVVTGSLAIGLFLFSGMINLSYEEMYASYEGSVVRKDHTATVVSFGQGKDKMLLVNGVGTTHITPVTKVMAHLPLILMENSPKSGLTICLGMGTTYRSMLSWNIQVTAVELVPSVKESMEYFFYDAVQMTEKGKGKIIIDDGRRFLKRTDEKFDVITIDPPPPLEAEGSSLLYSEEFYELVKAHLNENGVLQQWFPGGEFKILQAIARSLYNSFPHIKVFKSIEGWGFHFIASKNPITMPSIAVMVSRMPEKARKDLLEWYEEVMVEQAIKNIIYRELPAIEKLLNNDITINITDDRPFNEYYLVRRYMDRKRGAYRLVF